MSRTKQTLVPRTVADLAQSLAEAHRSRTAVNLPDLRHLNAVIAHVPEDMTATVEAGLTLAALQDHLSPHAQWLPIDPPRTDSLTIGELLAFDRSGPRRYGYGAIRDHVIGMRVALADGRVIKSGGQVVKNVAGFDLLKLFIGDRGSLGVIVEVSLKLLPRPRMSVAFDWVCPDLNAANQQLESLVSSPVTPVALDFYHLNTERHLTLRVLLEGVPEDVAWQEAEIRRLGFQLPSPDDFETRFWRTHTPETIEQRSVLPSRLTPSLSGLMNQDFIARAGNGIIYTPKTGLALVSREPTALARGVKETFDPHHILPEVPA